MIALMRTLIRWVFVVWLALLMAGVLLIGVAVALLSTLWSLLRGRKPVLLTTFMRFRQASAQFHNAMRRPAGATCPSQPDVTDVVDVQAKELPAHRISVDSHQP